jgi:hypothetical protein
MRFRLRTLLIVLALGPPVLAGLWFSRALDPYEVLGFVCAATPILAISLSW